MYKTELKTIADKYGIAILRNPITSEAYGLILETPAEIPDLSEIVKGMTTPPVVGTIEYTGDICVTYKIICPTSWFDLWGWR